MFCHFLFELFDISNCIDVDVEFEGLFLGRGFEYQSYHLKNISNHISINTKECSRISKSIVTSILLLTQCMDEWGIPSDGYRKIFARSLGLLLKHSCSSKDIIGFVRDGEQLALS